MDALSYFALAILIFVVLILSYGMIAIHDIPYHMAKSRGHPHADAIHAAGWISLFTLHAIWPFLWIWATAYDPVHGYAGKPRTNSDPVIPEGSAGSSRFAELEKKIAALEASAAKSGSPKS
jgi:hypothetical protein